MIKQLKIDFKDDFEESVVGSTVSADIVSPHVNHKHVSDCQREERAGLLEGQALLTTLLRVTAFNVEHENVLVLVDAHPDALGRLGATIVLVHDVEFC